MIVQRKEYLDTLKKWREKQIIKVVTGVRRCGKSTLFSLYINYLIDSGVSENQIIYVNLEEIEHENLLDYKALYDYIKERLVKGKYTYIFIDEVQQCKFFEKVIDSLYIKENVDLYITGSNAVMLSGELATLLSGRYIEISMLPLSFTEYLDFSKEKNIRTAFNDYLRYGSFPYVAGLEKKDTIIRTYLEGIYNTILIKDVATRESITDISVLESIIKFLSSNIGSPVSAKKVSDTINSSGRKISVNTVDSYIRALNQSYVFYKADRYDIKGKQYLKTLGKYYIVDTGLRNMLLTGSASDLGHLLENLVYLELMRRGYKIHIGKLIDKEIDFVVSGVKGNEYYQVSASVLDKNTMTREISPLMKISDNHPKYLLTLDDIIPNANYNGILHINLIEWLLNK
jgi:predicted AAA+ superfamily ATPase